MADSTKCPPALAEVRAKRDEILRLAARYDAHNVRLFGSAARGEATADSDLDFLVDAGANCSLFDLGGLLMDLQELLRCDVDVVSTGGLRDRIRERVLGEAVAI